MILSVESDEVLSRTVADELATKGQQQRRWLREPLLHFIVLGLLLFAANSFITHGRTVAATPKQIDITIDDLRQMAIYFQSQWGRPPTPEEVDRHLAQVVD